MAWGERSDGANQGSEVAGMNTSIEIWIQNIANQPLHSNGPSFNPMLDSGNNYDDAYSMGFEDGRVALAQEILSKLPSPEVGSNAGSKRTDR